jgi:hypothetical protein
MSIPYYSRIEVKVINKPYYAEGDINYPSTAVISFYDDANRFIQAEDYGFLTASQLYDQIDQTGGIDINHCYVHNFSITTYRRSRIMAKDNIVKLKFIKAHKAMLNSDYNIDFSLIELEDGKVDFSETHFIHGVVNFSKTLFGNSSVDFSYCVFRSKKCDFSNAIFGEGEISFKNTVFYKGEKIFQYTDFGKGEKNFVNTEFGGGDTSFINANFNAGDVSFKVARFGDGRVDFHFARFGKGDISFERTEFGNGPKDFRTVEFNKGKVNFNRADFGDGEVNFEACSANGRVTFKKTRFGSGNKSFELMEFDDTELNYEKTDWGKGNISFLNTACQSLYLNGCHIDSYCDLRVKHCDHIDLSDTIVRDIVDLKPNVSDVKLDTLNITGMRLLGIIYIDWEQNRVKELIRKQTQTTHLQKAEQFRTLKESFNKSGQYNDEDSAYVWFKRYELESDYQTRTHHKPMNRILQVPSYLMQKLIFDYVGLYATNPFRVLVSMVVAIFSFALVYYTILITHLGGIMSGIGGEHDMIGNLGRSIYHSGITFFTIGFGDFYPLGLVRWFSQLEGFTGVFMMSYFTVAFVRKILR